MNHEYKYIAFISYKREDEKWAKWLQHKLEHYKLPTSVRKTNPTLPERIRPVFKDTTDLAGGLLEKTIKEALNSSKYLIVVCSPRATQSPWVCKEVQEFIDLGREEYIIPFIIDGEPNSSNKDTECFPKNLKALSGARELLGININEMGRNAAVIKVVARVSGLKFDILWQRWERFRKRRYRLITVFSVLGMVVALSILYIMYGQYRKIQVNQARAVANQAERLVAEGNSILARRILLEVLPESSDLLSYPYVAEVEAAFRLALKCNDLIINHEYEIQSVSVNSTGSLIAVGSLDGQIGIYDAKSAVLLKTFIGHTGMISDVSFSVDGKLVVSGSYDNTIKVWDVESGMCKLTLCGHKQAVSSTSFNQDGTMIVSASLDGTLKLWNAISGECLYTYEDDGRLISVTVSHGGKHIAYSSDKGEIKLLNLDSMQCAKILKGHMSEVNDVCFSSNDSLIVSASDDKTVKIWDIKKNECIVSFDDHKSEMYCASFSKDSKYAVSGSRDGSIIIWNIDSGTIQSVLRGHQMPVMTVAFTPDDNSVVSSSYDKTIRVWDIERNYDTDVVSLCDEPCRLGVFSPDGKCFMSVSNTQIRLWDLSDKACLLTLGGHERRITAASFNRDGMFVISSSVDGVIKLWSLSEKSCIGTFTATCGVTNVEFSPDDKYVACSCQNGDIKILDIVTGKVMRTLAGHFEAVLSTSFSPDGKYLLSISDDSTMRIWDFNSGNCLRLFDNNEVWFNSAQFDPEGEMIVTSSLDGSIRVWDIKEGICTQTIRGHAGMALYAEFSPNGKYIVSSSSDQSIKVWEVLSGKCVMTLNGHEDRVNSAKFSPEGDLILSASSDNSLRIWTFPELKDLIYEVRACLGKTSLTDKQRREFYLDE